MCTKGYVFLACCKSATPVSCWPHAQTIMSVSSRATTSGVVRCTGWQKALWEFTAGVAQTAKICTMYCPRTDLAASTVLRHVTRTCHFCHHVVSISLKCWLHARENVLSVPVLAACMRKRPFCLRAGCMHEKTSFLSPCWLHAQGSKLCAAKSASLQHNCWPHAQGQKCWQGWQISLCEVVRTPSQPNYPLNAAGGKLAL